MAKKKRRTALPEDRVYTVKKPETGQTRKVTQDKFKELKLEAAGYVKGKDWVRDEEAAKSE